MYLLSMHFLSFPSCLCLSVYVCMCVCVRAHPPLRLSLYRSSSHSLTLTHSRFLSFPSCLRLSVYVCVCVRIILVFSLHRSWTKEIGDKGGLVYMYTRATPSRDSTLPPLP